MEVALLQFFVGQTVIFPTENEGNRVLTNLSNEFFSTLTRL